MRGQQLLQCGEPLFRFLILCLLMADLSRLLINSVPLLRDSLLLVFDLCCCSWITLIVTAWTPQRRSHIATEGYCKSASDRNGDSSDG